MILLFLLRTSKNNLHKLLVAILATLLMTALSTVWMAARHPSHTDPLRVYYGTDTRAAGFLVGALLAVSVLYNKFNEFQPFLYRGGILVTAMASALLIVDACTPTTWTSRLLERRDVRRVETPVRHKGFRASLRLIKTTFRQWSVPQKVGYRRGPRRRDLHRAAPRRKMEDVPALVETLSREGHLSLVVVVHPDSTRPFEAPVFERVMGAYLAHNVERVIFINVHHPIGWEYYLNQKFVEGVSRRPQAELIDWDDRVHSEQRWFCRDQSHLSYARREASVNAIQETLEADP